MKLHFKLLLDLWLDWLSLFLQIKMIASEIFEYGNTSGRPSVYLLANIKFLAKKDFIYFLQGARPAFGQPLTLQAVFVYIAIPHHL